MISLFVSSTLIFRLFWVVLLSFYSSCFSTELTWKKDIYNFNENNIFPSQISNYTNVNFLKGHSFRGSNWSTTCLHCLPEGQNGQKKNLKKNPDKNPKIPKKFTEFSNPRIYQPCPSTAVWDILSPKVSDHTVHSG